MNQLWCVEDIDALLNQSGQPIEKAATCSTSSLVQKDQDTNAIDFFLTDVFEDYAMSPGQIFLFGRIPVHQTTESVCVVLNNVPRNLYFLPALKENGERYSVSEVKQEVFGIMNKLVQNPRELAFRIDRKKYAFEIADIPTEEVLLVWSFKNRRIISILFILENMLSSLKSVVRPSSMCLVGIHRMVYEWNVM